MSVQLVIPKNVSNLRNRVKFLSSLLVNPKFYRYINNVLSDPSVLDRSLGTLCYFMLFVSAIIKRYPKLKKVFSKVFNKVMIVYKQLLDRIIYQNQNLEKNIEIKETNNKVESLDGSSDEEFTPFLQSIYNMTKNFSGYITDIRIFNRGFSVPGSIADLLEASQLLKDGDYLNYFSTVCISLYQPCETIAFMMDHNWLLPDRKANDPDWWYILSTKFWFVWVVAEFTQLGYKLFITKRGKNISKDEFIEFTEQLATLPLCVHWSSENGWLDDLLVGFFATIAGGLSTIDTWKDIIQKMSSEIN